MKILITGAGGFIGRVLVSQLLERESSDSCAFDSLTLVDVSLTDLPVHPRLRLVEGSMVDEPIFARALDPPPDLVFHLATIGGGLAEENFELGRQVNLDLTLRLLEKLRQLGNKPTLIFTSSIGVYGSLHGPLNDDTPPRPDWSYGTHKLVAELLIADYSRKGFIDGRCVRLPGIVARPATPGGAMLSSFMSDLIRDLAEGKPYTCPVSPTATAWWMSVSRCAKNLLHAVSVAAENVPPDRVWMLPALHCSMSEIVDSLARTHGPKIWELISYRPQPALEKKLASFPPLQVKRAQSAGFRHDGSIDSLVVRALDSPSTKTVSARTTQK
jgi:nucleoside-diphosphate-sugar epimerase